MWDEFFMERIPDLEALGDVFAEEKGWRELDDTWWERGGGRAKQQFIAEVHRAEFDDDMEMLAYLGQKKERLETLLPGVGPLVLVQPLLLALDTNVVAARLVAMQGVLEPAGADVSRLVMAHPSVLLSPDPVELVTSCLAAMRAELPGAVALGPLLARRPGLLCRPTVREDLAEVGRRHPGEDVAELAAADPDRVAAWISHIWV